jgi:hypothetical protein
MCHDNSNILNSSLRAFFVFFVRVIFFDLAVVRDGSCGSWQNLFLFRENQSKLHPRAVLGEKHGSNTDSQSSQL